MGKIWTGVWTGTLASVLENLLKIPRMMIITRVLGPELYGLLGLFGGFRELIGSFIQLGTGDAVIQFLASDRARKDYPRISATMGAASAIRLITISALTLAYFGFEQDIIFFAKSYPAMEGVANKDMVWLLRLLLAGVVIQSLEGPLGNALQGFQAWRALLVVRIIGAFASAGFPILAALLGFHLLGIVVAQQLAFAVIAAAISYYYWVRVKRFLTQPPIKDILALLRPVLDLACP